MFTKIFLKGLLKYLIENLTTRDIEIEDWLDGQELATQGGFYLLGKYCEENSYDYYLEMFLGTSWDDFDNLIATLSQELINTIE